MNPLHLIGSVLTTIVFLSSAGCPPAVSENAASLSAQRPVSDSPVPAQTQATLFAAAWREQVDATRADLENNLIVWRQAEVSNYDFVIGKYAGGNTNPWNRSPVVIRVREDAVTSIETADKSDISELARTDGFEEIDTIDKLFGYLKGELDRGRLVTASFDKKLGFPKAVQIRHSFETHGTRMITITKLQMPREPERNES